MTLIISLFFFAGLGFLLWILIYSLSKPYVRPTTQSHTPVLGWQFAGIYKKRQYLFDATSEFHMFNILNELFGDKYYIFPQMNLNHIVAVKTTGSYQKKPFETRINKKSVDFVLCDKTTVVPLVAIELDGSSHDNFERQKRDHFVDQLMKDVGMPIVHLRVGVSDRMTIKNEILNKISN